MLVNPVLAHSLWLVTYRFSAKILLWISHEKAIIVSGQLMRGDELVMKTVFRNIYAPFSVSNRANALIAGVILFFAFFSVAASAQQVDPIWKPKDTALVIIDYQPEMLKGLKTADANSIGLNVRMLARIAKTYDMPVVLSTVGVGMGYNKPTVDSIRNEIPDVEEIDRSTMNAWDDENFVAAVKATGRKRLVMVGLWTEICLVFPVVDAISDGYEVSIVVDSVGGTSQIAHDTAITRMVQAGAIPTTIPTFSTEVFRDWMSEDGKKIGDVLNWYLAEVSKEHLVDVFNSKN